MRRAVVVMAVALVGLSACGGAADEESDAASSDTTTTTTTSTVAAVPNDEPDDLGEAPEAQDEGEVDAQSEGLPGLSEPLPVVAVECSELEGPVNLRVQSVGCTVDGVPAPVSALPCDDGRTVLITQGRYGIEGEEWQPYDFATGPPVDELC